MANSNLSQTSSESSTTTASSSSSASSSTSSSVIAPTSPSNHVKCSQNGTTSMALNNSLLCLDLDVTMNGNGHNHHNNHRHHVQRSRQRWKLLSKAVRSKSYQLSFGGTIDGGGCYASDIVNGDPIEDHQKNGTENIPLKETVTTNGCHPRRKVISPIQRLSSDTCNLTIQTYGLMKYDFEVKKSNGNYESLKDCSKIQWISCQWNRFLLENGDDSGNLKLFIKFVENHFNSFQELAGFDNSGNVRIWPCEELLAYLVGYGLLREKISDTVICELGAGMTALAGLMIVALGLHRSIYLTDGNSRCVQNIESIVDRNFCPDDHSPSTNARSQRPDNIKVQQLRWEVPTDYQHLRNRIETIICADCLFVDRRHRELLNTIDTILVDEPDNRGQVFLLAPQRGTTLQQFINLVNSDGDQSTESPAPPSPRFQIEIIEHFNQTFFRLYHSLVAQLVQNTGADPTDLQESYFPYLLVMKRRNQPV